MSRITEIDSSFAPDPMFKANERETVLLSVVDRRMEALARRINARLIQLDQELDVGNPGLAGIEALKGNLAGTWASNSILVAGSAVTFTHNLNLPLVAVPGQAYNHCNVAWFARFIYGDRTGANGAPAAGGATAHSSIYFRLGDTVTANSIQLRVQSDLSLSAATPLYIDVRFFPAIT